MNGDGDGDGAGWYDRIEVGSERFAAELKV